MKYLILFLLSLSLQLSAQDTKGARPTHHSSLITHHSTRAVVIGISNYQDPAIPDLRFAHRDAEAFANFLRSPAGGSLDGDHLKVLTDSAATTAQFDAALGWLIDESKESDQAIIYFSGHGDVETKTRSQQGFLLCWDSPPQAYVSGAYPIFFLKEVVSTLSLQNKARVVIITDACRSGKLAGNAVDGSQLTSQNLAQQFANEIKILSCQPNEYSIEGEQWGGGRGAFSYHLVDGLYGMADGNNDQSVSLLEIGRYLDDHVTTEVAPQSQVPLTVGNRTETLAAVFPDLLEQMKKNKAGQLPTFSPTESRGIEDEVLATVDTTIRELYKLFKQALKNKLFLEPAGACANAYYERLVAEPKLKRLHNAMRRNFAAALQDDAQQVLNSLLKNDIKEYSLSPYKKRIKYKDFPAYLERAADLLGRDHYMYPVLKARHYFFKGMVGSFDKNASGVSDYKPKTEQLHFYRQALAWQPDFPHVYLQISLFYGPETWLDNRDSAEFFALRARDLAPTWIKPYTVLATLNMDDTNKADSLFQIALKLDSTSAIAWYEYGLIRSSWQHPNDVIPRFQRAIALDSTFAAPYMALGFCFSGLRQHLQAEKMYQKVLAMDSTNLEAYWRLAASYECMHQWSLAEQTLLKLINLAPGNLHYSSLASLYDNMGDVNGQVRIYKMLYERDTSIDYSKLYSALGLLRIYLKSYRSADAEKLIQEFISMFESSKIAFIAYLELGSVFMDAGLYMKAESYFFQALTLDAESCWLHYRMGKNYLLDKRFSAAEKSLKTAAAFDGNHYQNFALADLGLLYSLTGRLNEAEEVSKKVLGLETSNMQANANMAILATLQGQYAEAFSYIEKILAFHYKWKLVGPYLDDPRLTPLKELPEWVGLMKKYFPYETKN